MPELSLVIPCYNEAGNLPALVARVVEVFGDRDAEVILVDNGSTDDTPEAMARLIAGHEFIHGTRVEVNQGYGFGILSGLAVAAGEVLAWTHADLQADPAEIAIPDRSIAISRPSAETPSNRTLDVLARRATPAPCT